MFLRRPPDRLGDTVKLGTAENNSVTVVEGTWLSKSEFITTLLSSSDLGPPPRDLALEALLCAGLGWDGSHLNCSANVNSLFLGDLATHLLF